MSIEERAGTCVRDEGHAVGLAVGRGARRGQRPVEQAIEAIAGFPFLLRDDQTGSLWDLTGRAIEGPLAGAQLEPIATFSAMWFAWAAFNPDAQHYAP